MRKSTGARLARTAIGVLAVGMLAGCASAAPAAPDLEGLEPPAAASSVETLGILGDSVSLGVNACAEPGQCAKASWSGGSEPEVGSIAGRLAAASGVVPAVVNAAKDGGDVQDALGLVDEVLQADPQLVTVLLGGNDACAPTLNEMTSAADFEARLTALFARLNAEAPDATILALSVPNLGHLWEIGHADERAVQTWNSSPSCKNLLGSADDASAEATARRDAVSARVDEYNAAIGRVCAAAERCIDDGGAVHAYEFTAEEISAIDFFHPSIAGQRVIAGLAWDSLERGTA
ncbi:SGNH/GDSL hydrolase family protein [Agromyces sp. NPDC058484]|uniref:SGNH/GDSL hydrolase family protein n=1 Tax=Agromyces sp. NPDC058484 TaxID=3346524 RepID=UPI003647CCCC